MEVSFVFCLRGERGLGRKILQSLHGQSVKFSLAEVQYKAWAPHGVKIGIKKGRAVNESCFSSLAQISSLRSRDLKMFCEFEFTLSVNILEQYQMYLFGRQQVLVLLVPCSILSVSFCGPCESLQSGQTKIVSCEVFGIYLYLGYFRLDQEQALEGNLLVIPALGLWFCKMVSSLSTQMGFLLGEIKL